MVERKFVVETHSAGNGWGLVNWALTWSEAITSVGALQKAGIPARMEPDPVFAALEAGDDATAERLITSFVRAGYKR